MSDPSGHIGLGDEQPNEAELIRRHYGDFRGLYDPSQALAHIRVLLAENDRLKGELSEDLHAASRCGKEGPRCPGCEIEFLHAELDEAKRRECTALCRDVEEDRDRYEAELFRLRPVVEAAKAWARRATYTPTSEMIAEEVTLGEAVADMPHAFEPMPASSIGSCLICRRPALAPVHTDTAGPDAPAEAGADEPKLYAPCGSDRKHYSHEYTVAGYPKWCNGEPVPDSHVDGWAATTSAGADGQGGEERG